MHPFVLAAVVGLASSRPQLQLPAGLSAAACPNYPFCGASAPADFPTPVVNGQPIAPILNTTPEQTAFWQEAQVAKSPASFPVTVVDGQNVAPGYNTVPAQTAAHENHLLIAQQQQLQQLIDAQTIQHRIQQQEIEAARCGDPPNLPLLTLLLQALRQAVGPPSSLSSPRLILDSEVRHKTSNNTPYLQNSIKLQKMYST